MKVFKSFLFLLSVTFCSLSANAQNERSVEVGGAPMYASLDIIDNAMKSGDHTTLVRAVKTAGLVETLKGKGPFTVFAPTDVAFKKLPSNTLKTLLMPQNMKMLRAVLTYHVVPGRLDVRELDLRIAKGGGTAELQTVAGGKLWVMKKDDRWWVKDEKGNAAEITIADVYQSNGVIHVVDRVLMSN